jgi:hypothetical protein
LHPEKINLCPLGRVNLRAGSDAVKKRKIPSLTTSIILIFWKQPGTVLTELFQLLYVRTFQEL